MSAKNYEELLEISKEIFSYRSIFQLLSWDQETYMPPGSIEVRSHQMALMAEHIHHLKTGEAFKNALEKLIDPKTKKIASGLTDSQERAVREWHKDFTQATKLPASFVKKLSKASAKAMNVWANARKKDDFSLFAPHLKVLVDLVREKASILGYQDHPYDALIDLYEPNMTTKKLDDLFSGLKIHLLALLKKIAKAPQVDESPIQGVFPRKEQLLFGNLLLEKLHLDKNYARMDESTHPFSLGLHPHDTRITTRIDETNLMSNILSILHECGHAFYEMGLDLDHYGSPLSEAVSLGIHESQSRLWETRIGRSRPFWKYFYPSLQKSFPQFTNIPFDNFYRAIHAVKPSFIRVEADEVTYCLHIILRFEMEKSLIDGSLEVEDIPAAWNAKSKELFGITPPSDALGCLQDIHWSMGELGYFPTYALGNMYASHFFKKFMEEHPDWESRVEKGELVFVRKWLNEKIHRKGRTHSPEELAELVTGEPFSEDAYVEYLTRKYGEIYS